MQLTDRSQSVCQFRKTCYRICTDCTNEKYVENCESRIMANGEGVKIEGHFLLSPAQRQRNKKLWDLSLELEQDEVIDKKTCRVCHVLKPITEFGVSLRYKDGRNTICKDCKNLERRTNREKKKEEKCQTASKRVKPESWR